jgi:hypothetical protein
VPDFKSKRATNFGFGNRGMPTKGNFEKSLTVIDDSPPPNVYTIKSAFDSRQPDGRAFTFGISREAYKKVYLKNHPPKDKAIPGPG